MCRQELIAPRPGERAPNGSERTFFVATDGGRELLVGWLGEPIVDAATEVSALALKLIVLRNLDINRTPLLERQQLVFRATLAELGATQIGVTFDVVAEWHREATLAASRLVARTLANELAAPCSASQS